MFNQNRIDLQSYWQQLIPDLRITDRPLQAFDKTQLSESGLDDTQLKQLRDEGYFRTAPIIPPALSKRLAAAVQKISSLGLPPVYAFVYDEFWALLGSFDKLLTPLLDEGYRLKLIDPWIWQLNKNDKGFAPHRDLPAAHIYQDGRPTLLNLWIALTDATPLNGCIYVLPTHLDPNHPDHLERIEIGINDAQNIRAVPAKAGAVLGWSPAILHWGAQSSQWAETPRISLGNALLQNTKHAPAEASYKEAIRLNPNIVDAYIGLSHAHHAQANLDDAMTAITKALQLHPGHAAATEFHTRLQKMAER